MIRPARCLATVVTVLALPLVACGTGSGAGPDGPVELLVFGDPDELAAYRTLVDAFEAGSDMEVELVETSDREDLIARLSTSLGAGDPPDVFLMNYRYYGQFAANGSIQPLDDRLADSTVLDTDEMYPVAVDAFRWQDEQLCLPQNVSSLQVYYNRTLFERYGVAEPAADWTWNDMLQTAVTLTRDANGNQVVGTESDGQQVVDVYGLGVEASMIRLAPLVWSNGGEIVDDPEQPTRFTLDTPEARQVLKDFLDLRLAYGVIPTDAELEALDDETRFVNGKLAMVLSSRRATTTFRTITDFEWDVAPLPMYGEQAGILHSDAYCITSQSQRQDEAWEFLEFALDEEGQQVLVETGRTVPSDIDVSRSDAFLDSDEPPSRSEVFLDAIESIRPMPVISTWPEIEDVTSAILEDALYKGLTVDETIRLLDEETRDLFARGEYP